jgi:hypothetical protein
LVLLSFHLVSGEFQGTWPSEATLDQNIQLETKGMLGNAQKTRETVKQCSKEN